jgi:hypothetical protein
MIAEIQFTRWRDDLVSLISPSKLYTAGTDVKRTRSFKQPGSAGPACGSDAQRAASATLSAPLPAFFAQPRASPGLPQG